MLKYKGIEEIDLLELQWVYLLNVAALNSYKRTYEVLITNWLNSKYAQQANFWLPFLKNEA